MNNTIKQTRQLATALLASTIVPFALAQISQIGIGANAVSAAHTSAISAANAATQAQAASQNAVNAAGSTGANLGVAGQGAASSAVHPPAGGVNAAGNLSSSASTSANRSDVSADLMAGANSSVNGQLGHTGANTGIAGEDSVAINSKATANQIRAIAFESRDQIAANVESRLDATNRIVANLKNQTAEMHDDARVQFQAAITAAHQREAAVRSTLRAIRTARKEQFEKIRERLADNYEAYATAVANVEATGTVNAADRK